MRPRLCPSRRRSGPKKRPAAAQPAEEAIVPGETSRLGSPSGRARRRMLAVVGLALVVALVVVISPTRSPAGESRLVLSLTMRVRSR